MKLSKYAKENGICYKTAWRWFKDGVIQGHQLPTGTILIENSEKEKILSKKVAIYTRVSSSENKKNLDSQAERLVNYCISNGYKIEKVVKEIGSGINDKRPKLLSLLEDKEITIIVIEHKDRLTRFGFNYIEKLLNVSGRKLEIVNKVEEGKEDIIQDFVSIITSFCARIYGNRRSKRKTEQLIKELRND